jgi:hypothetical protein
MVLTATVEICWASAVGVCSSRRQRREKKEKKEKDLR